MNRRVVKRMGTCLLALVLALSLLPAGALAEETEEGPETAEEEGFRETETLPETPEEPVEVPETEETPAPEETEPRDEQAEPPASVPADAETEIGLQSAEEITVTTGEAANITAFSAEVSLEVRDTSSGTFLREAMESGSSVGFEYTPDDPSAEGNPQYYSISVDGTFSEDSKSVAATGSIPCEPSTTYWYRAYFLECAADGTTQPYSYSNWNTFTSPADTSSQELSVSSSPLEFNLAQGESEVLYLSADTTGFYVLSASAENAGVSLWIWRTEAQNWSQHFPLEPIYLEPGQRPYVKVTLDWMQESDQESATVSVSLQEFPIQELTLEEETAVTFENNTAYFSFTPREDGTYLIKAALEDTSASGWLGVWNTETKSWDGGQSFAGEETRALAGSGNVKRYLMLNANGGSGSETGAKITVSRFTEEITSPTASAGAAKITDGFRASIPLTVKAPLNTKLEAGIEYKIGENTTFRDFCWLPEDGTLVRLGTIELRTFPNAEYQYRAFVEIQNGETRETFTEETWHTFHAGDAECITLQEGKSENFQDSGYFCFMPQESTVYKGLHRVGI